MSENYELKVGSKYDIHFPDDDNSFCGIFLGYSMVGTESAIVVKTVSGREMIRFIPVSQIFYMDLVESAEEPVVRSRPENLYG